LAEQTENNIRITVGAGTARKRIDSYLVEILTDKSRNYIQKLLENNSIFIDGRPVQKNHKIKPGDILEIKNPDKFELPPDIEPENIGLNILYEDDYFLIISKPPGLSVHPARGNYNNTLVNALLYHFSNNMKNFPDKIRPGIVHRLDKETSGILIVAKSPDIQRKLSDLFKKRMVKKCYTALVYGKFVEKSGEIDLPIGRSRLDRKKMAVLIDRGREAVTKFHVKDYFKNNCSLLYVYPKTGRTHQIRVHLSYIDHPLIGDKKYGNKDTDRITEEISLKRQFLHANKISFKHPVSGIDIELEDRLADDLLKSLEILENFKI
jgi:23S rRNA pseudouridine1911/1915/1917 synthase